MPRSKQLSLRQMGKGEGRVLGTSQGFCPIYTVIVQVTTTQNTPKQKTPQPFHPPPSPPSAARYYTHIAKKHCGCEIIFPKQNFSSHNPLFILLVPLFFFPSKNGLKCLSNGLKMQYCLSRKKAKKLILGFIRSPQKTLLSFSRVLRVQKVLSRCSESLHV